MSHQFINCPKCGTRNFSDEKKCGVCNSRLIASNLKTHKDNNSMSPGKPNYFILVLIFGGIIFIYYNLFRNDKSNDKPNTTFVDNSFQSPVSSTTPTNISSKETSNNKELETLPEMSLAIINDRTETPDQTTILLFRQDISSLKNKFKTSTKRDIANALVAAHNIIIKYGETETLLEFTTGFNAFSKELDNNFNLQIEQSLSLYIKTVYKL